MSKNFNLSMNEAIREILLVLGKKDRAVIVFRHPDVRLKNSLIVQTTMPQSEVVRLLAEKDLLRGLVIYVQPPKISPLKS